MHFLRKTVAAMAVLAMVVGCQEKEPVPNPAEVAKQQAEAQAAAEAKARAEAAAMAEAKQQQALAIGVEAVIYGLPQVIMDLTREKVTNVAKPEGFAAPINQFVNVRAFPDAAFRDVVRANVDTLYSSAFLDLTSEPIILTVPDTKGRYYLMPMLDAWTNVFASPGKRTTGTKAGKFAITGPGWEGELPKGVTQIMAPTNLVWIIGRTQTNGPGDYKAVHAIQDGFKLTPLSAFGKPYTPPEGAVNPDVDMKTPPVEQLKAMSTEEFFNRLASLLKTNPAPEADAPMLQKLLGIGVIPGEKYDPSKLDPDLAKGLSESVAVAMKKLEAATKDAGEDQNGWRVPPMILGNYGTDYTARAVVALMGLGANLPQDAVYPTSFVDGEGNTLNGTNRYVIHFDKGATPPVNAFWSLTMYDQDSFFVANPINRYAISSWMPLKKNKDGSVDIFVQKDSPGKDKESNWLPAAEGEFSVTMRMYWPTDKAPSILDGSWKPTAITKQQ